MTAVDPLTWMDFRALAEAKFSRDISEDQCAMTCTGTQPILIFHLYNIPPLLLIRLST